MVLSALGKTIRDTISTCDVAGRFAGVASLKDNQEYIERELGVDSLEKIYDVKNRDISDQDKIEKVKGNISDVLLKKSNEALSPQKKTTCKKCGYKSKKMMSLRTTVVRNAEPTIWSWKKSSVNSLRKEY